VKITGFTWLEDIVEKLWDKHNVAQEEVLEVFNSTPTSGLLRKVIEKAKMCILP